MKVQRLRRMLDRSSSSRVKEMFLVGPGPGSVGFRTSGVNPRAPYPKWN